MPQGDSPYLPLAQTIVKTAAARGAFLYVMEGQLGDSWCVWAPPEVMAGLPELIEACAREIETGATAGATEAPLAIIDPGNVNYQDMAEFIVRRAEAKCVFVYVLEGRAGSGWAASGAPDVSPMMLAELLHGFAEDMTHEEAARRREQGLHVERAQ